MTRGGPGFDPRPIVPPCTGYCRGQRPRNEAAATYHKTILSDGPNLFCKCCQAFLVWAPAVDVETFKDEEGDGSVTREVPGDLTLWLQSQPIGSLEQDADRALERASARCPHCGYNVRYFRLRPKRH